MIKQFGIQTSALKFKVMIFGRQFCINSNITINYIKWEQTHQCMWVIQACPFLCQGYVPEEYSANWTQNFHLKQCISCVLGDWQPHPV
jgi:hypothetical protein